MNFEEIKRPYFFFNGTDSRKMGIEFCEIEKISKSKSRMKEITIPGRDGVLHENEKSMEPSKIEIRCVIKNSPEIRDNIKLWLSGSGDLILSSDLKKKYRATIVNEIPIEKMMSLFNKFMVSFSVFPYAYHSNEKNDFLTLERNSVILNKGNAPSEPIIKIYGTGEITLFINDIPYKFSFVDEYVTINSEIMEVYKDDLNKSDTFIFPLINDFFPIFKTGKNEIRWSGNVTKLEIQPNWRWL